MSEQPGHVLVPEWTLGWRMQRALAHAGVSVERIAAELEVSRSTVSRWLNDRGSPPRSVYLKEWALRTGVPVSWLRHGDEPTPRMGVKMPRSWTPGILRPPGCLAAA